MIQIQFLMTHIFAQMKHSLAGTQKEEKSPRTHSHRHIHSSKKRQTEKHKKQDSNQCSPAAAPNLIPLYIAQCSLSVSLPQCSSSFPLHLTPSLYSSVFPPPSLTLMKKRGRVLWRYSEGVDKCWQRRWREMKRDRDRREKKRKRHWQRENMIWCSPEMPTDKTLVLCKRGSGATQNKGVMA